MRVSVVCCLLGIIFVLVIAALHASGFSHYTNQMNETNASVFLKDMFPILYVIPSLYLIILAAFGALAIFLKKARRSICLILAPAVLAAGALALMLGEWVPLVVMGCGGGLFLAAALTVGRYENID